MTCSVGPLLKDVLDHTDGDPASALTLLAEAAAELIKESNVPQNTRDKFVAGLDQFLTLPSQKVVAAEATH